MSSLPAATTVVVGQPTTSSIVDGQPAATSSQNNGNTTSSSLYLFTFLATLLLLLAVSCAIVARSLVVRRRFRRRVEEAIAAGLISPQQAAMGAGFGGGGMRKRDIGQKPTMWDSWLAPGEAKWSEIKPVSVKVISDTLTGAGLPRETPKNNGRSSATNSNDNARPRRRLLSAIPFPLTYHRSPTPQPSPIPSGTHSPSSEEKIADSSPAELQVAVLIAMPSPYRPQSWGAVLPDGTSAVLTSAKGKERSGSMYMDGEEDLPDVVFGVTEVSWNPPMQTDVLSGDANSVSNYEKTA